MFSTKTISGLFRLTELEDNVQIAPDLLQLKLVEAVREEIGRKLANKVMPNVGMCIGREEIVSVDDSIILPGDGSPYIEVIFRYVVFRPMVGTVITGKIRNSSPEGVHVTLGFFDDILIPHAALQHPSRFDEAEQAWVWEYPLEEGAKHELVMDVGEPIKFRVTHEIFEETSPIGLLMAEAQSQQGSSTSSAAAAQEVKPPYKIFGSINEGGLGLLSWWNLQDDEDDEGYDDEDGESSCEE